MCDSIVAIGAETTGGTTLYGKNSDRKGGECQPFVQHPEASHPPHARLRCTHIEIPQVAETYRIMGHSPWWVWGFEHGVNEHGVGIGNHTVFSNETVEGRAGLIGMDLVRLGLERGRSAREALEVIAALVETHGQGGPARAPDAGGYHNSFVVADASEAWHLETSNRRWAARRTPLAAVSNHLSIGTNWEIGSRDLQSFAQQADWWHGKDRIDFAAAYRHPGVPGHVSEGRQRRGEALLREGRGRHDVASFARILRDHSAGGAVWRDADATPAEERFFTLCAHSEPVHWTTASMIAPLPAERVAPWPVWIGFGTPCTGMLLPVYLHGVIPPELARGGTRPEPDSTWWAFKALQDAAGRDPERTTPRLRTGWAPLEAEVEAERLEVERAAAREALAGAADTAALRVSEFMARTVTRATQRAEQLRLEIS